ncbi:MAG: DUF3734 domain-containing protein, partial [Proteobacteria bacterium]|nr:DUF3734 domain-containing protein [Pseudomonadota bacterium]
DIRYSSRTRLNTDAQLRIHKLKASLARVLSLLPEAQRNDPDVEYLQTYCQENTITVVQLIYRDRAYEGSFKDVEFSRQTMLDHWASGVGDGDQAIAQREVHAAERAALAAGDALAVDPGLRQAKTPDLGSHKFTETR